MQIENMEFNVQVSGKGDALLWGHGLTASIKSEDLLDIFEWDKFPKERRLVRYDARGHGETQPSFSPTHYHWESMAQDMILVADALGIEKFIAGGQSMGCASTIYVGMNSPHRVKGMILMNPPTAWETRAEQVSRYKTLAKIGGLLGGGILAKVMARNPERLLPGWLVEAKREKVYGFLEGIKPMKRKTLSNLFNGAALSDLPPREKIKTINHPALILGWSGDPSHPIETATELNELLPQSTLVVADNYSDFQRWPEIIREFVANVT